jgi:hypothetical protein
MSTDMDFQDWDLPAYPQLPKMFTNAKAAKKRKHKVTTLCNSLTNFIMKKVSQQHNRTLATLGSTALLRGSTGGPLLNRHTVETSS